ncbi:MAG: prenyltransferase/squalene oxidase repeat-containing protein [Opitutales bacterium]
MKLETKPRIWRMLVVACVLPALTTIQSVAQENSSGQRVGKAVLLPEVKAAISKGLYYLSGTQKSDGSWGDRHPVADTSLALMSYMLQGHVPGRKPYGQNMDRAVAYLINIGKKGHAGYMGTPNHHGGMYEHGLAILALSEAWGQSTNPALRNTLRRAVDITIRAQNHQGGWRYNPEPRDADLSMTVMQTVALNSAKEAGIAVPDATLEKAVKYVESCQDKTSGGFGYSGPSGPGFARTGAGVMSLIMCGRRDHPAVGRGMKFLRHYPDQKFSGGSHFLYANYYVIQCMYQMGTADFDAYYPRIADSLLKKQNQQDGRWSIKEGDTYSTAMAILILGVPYRFLPIYQR